jgi:hypothetical protein
VSRTLMAAVLVSGLAWTVTEHVAEPLEEHCVIYVIGQRADHEFVTSEPVCYKSLAEVDALLLSSTIVARRVDGVGLVSLSTFTLGRHYDGFNGTGSSISIVGSSCTGGYWNTTTGWDNRISSSYNGCAHLRHFSLPNKSGSTEDTYGAGQTDNLGPLNNDTESVAYYSS